MILKKRQLVTATLVLALGAAVFVNWYYAKPHADVSPAQAEATVTAAAENLGDAQYVLSDVSGKHDPFAEARLKREQAQDAALEALQDVLRDSSATEAATAEASKALAALTGRLTAESDIETLVQAKTGLCCLAILDDDSAQVLLEKTPQEKSVLLQISEIVVQKTDLDAADVTIIESV
ncbi:MAG: SpoIIIAH-like family protein [Clostridia bacterium]|nr:SpoIIIAH-like family protein [Clostridia bacterium]